MLSLRMRQKDAEFYFVSYPAQDLLPRVRFVSRFYGESGEAIGGEAPAREADDVEQFVQAVERSSDSFQRDLNKRKVRQIREFYRNEMEQPIIPGAVLLFTPEQLEFIPHGHYERMGDLVDPKDKYLIIDGQHRLAGLHFYLQEADANPRIEVPCVIFDGKAAEFAMEMFVLINSTHTRINKSHIIDLYEKVQWGSDPEKQFAAAVVKSLYLNSDSPLRYHINMLGGRSKRELWINQAQLFAEVHRWIRDPHARPFITNADGDYDVDLAYGFLSSLLTAASILFQDSWGNNDNYMVTRDVTIKALIRVASDAVRSADKIGLASGAVVNVEVFTQAFAPWISLHPTFRRDGFYERFPARGQAERVEKIRQRLARAAGVGKESE